MRRPSDGEAHADGGERLVHRASPTRICDLGGWTDTWFAAHGVVCHLAVWPGVEATVTAGTNASSEGEGVDVHVGAFARVWRWRTGAPPVSYPDPLLAATLDEIAPPAGQSWTLQVDSTVPAGASMGTSAATCVAVLSAFDEWLGTGRPVADQVARAHAIETRRLGWQSGIQDQWSAAPDAAHLIEVDAYPHATCRTLRLSATLRDRLDDTLLVVFMGRSHSSTAVHEAVVRALAHAGPDDPRLNDLRALARDGAAALETGDLDAYGRCLAGNTERQRQLHPGLVSADAQRVIDMAASGGALGWKINGAGGDGGTVTILCAHGAQRDRFAAAIPVGVTGTRILPVRLAQ